MGLLGEAAPPTVWPGDDPEVGAALMQLSGPGPASCQPALGPALGFQFIHTAVHFLGSPPPPRAAQGL